MFKTKKQLLSVLLLGIALGYFCFPSQPKGRIYIKYKHTWRSILNVHQSPERYLVVDGEEYKDVLGFAPYYLQVPKSDWIVFVQANLSQSGIHILNLKTGKKINVGNSGTDFGSKIGSPEQTNAAELIDPKTILLRVKDYPNEIQMKVDLESGEAGPVELLEFDQNHQVIKRSVIK